MTEVLRTMTNSKMASLEENHFAMNQNQNTEDPVSIISLRLKLFMQKCIQQNAALFDFILYFLIWDMGFKWTLSVLVSLI